MRTLALRSFSASSGAVQSARHRACQALRTVLATTYAAAAPHTPAAPRTHTRGAL